MNCSVRMGRGLAVGGASRIGSVEAVPRGSPCKTHISTRTLTVPVGEGGNAVLPSHHAPVQRRGVCGMEFGSMGPKATVVFSAIPSWRIDGSHTRSAREVTRCEHPARAKPGASKTHARSAKIAPAGTGADRFRIKNLVNRRKARFGFRTDLRPDAAVC
jgi:hypothetical protein